MKPKTVEELGLEVTRLRAEGRSFGEIGEELGITRQYAHKLWKAGLLPSEASTRVSTGASTRLSLRERRFVVGLGAGKSQTQAAIDAGAPPPSARVWATRAMQRDNVQSAYQRLLNRMLPEESVFEVHRQNLQATKLVIAISQGCLPGSN